MKRALLVPIAAVVAAGIAITAVRVNDKPEFDCGCATAKGVCEYVTADGGMAPAPTGRTLGPGYPPFQAFEGDGCARKPCVGLMTTNADGSPRDATWPEACPGG